MTNNFPLVSVIIPVYNAGTRLGKCIKSIICQSYQNLDIILIDDGSTDDSGQLCDLASEKDHRIKVIHQTNSGVSSARQKGIIEAKGEWGVFVDADDELPSNAIQSLIAEAEGFDIVTGGISIVKEDEQKEILSMPNIHETGLFSRYDYIHGLLIGSRLKSVWRQLVRMDILKKCIVNIPRQIKRSEDFLFNIFLGLYVNKVKGIKDVVYCYHDYPENTTRSVAMTLQNAVLIDRTLMSFLNDKPEFTEGLYRYRYEELVDFIMFKNVLETEFTQYVISHRKEFADSSFREKFVFFLCKVKNARLRFLLWKLYIWAKKMSYKVGV